MSDDDGEEPLGDLRREVESRTGDGEDQLDGARSNEGASETSDHAGESEDRPSERDERPSESDDGPLGDLRREVESRAAGEHSSDRSGDESPTGDDTDGGHFAEMDVDDVDPDEVWADLLFDDGGPTEGTFAAATGETADERPGQVVTKKLCHRCEYFGDPPTLHCTHEGTSIEELVDMDHYRVTNCPMIDDDYDPDEDGP